MMICCNDSESLRLSRALSESSLSQPALLTTYQFIKQTFATKKITKTSISKHKTLRIVRFQVVSPPAYVGHKIQLYPKSLEPSQGNWGQRANFCFLSTIKISHPHAITLRHLGVTQHCAAASRSTTWTVLLLAFSECTAAEPGPFGAVDIDDTVT